MNIPLLDLKAQYSQIREEVQAAINEVMESQHFILGPKVQELEEAIASYSQTKYALGVSSGTDALLLALMALEVGKDDIVITTPYSFFATAGCVARLGAIPKFVDIDEKTFNIDPEQLKTMLNSLTPDEHKRLKAVIPVHLFGQMADMEKILPICQEHNVPIIEDAAQAIGSECLLNGQVKRAGSIGAIGCFSFFPSKNLGGIGDGGMVVTNDPVLYEKMKIMRVHGSSPKYYHKFIGGNFRLDAIQAAVLLVKLQYLDTWTAQRQQHAKAYRTLLENNASVQLPPCIHDETNAPKHHHIYNQFCIRTEKRDELKNHLQENGIATEIYYPLPLHMQECFRYLGHRKGDFPKTEKAAATSLALPVFPELTKAQMEETVKVIHQFTS
ncbi:dTDP-4-amino-4,6-dideoxygalactose transaminase [Tindallia magadiensis]|uniref:dTDP-4-amino-4,6-dideoxygalactose transaminase n=1 Tax=Tindallia magadiensis TaxID=69895 RepID=A0A1I3D307_9FIRM|nr:DegT/DnrJ/EryC1/StrS family aminotransferase [Tindallia magadiensis]SFH81056.1 dTDP-4-amino-4,6-dideoxygalactose transaminase [Tindallia magadiensis]